MYRFVLRPFWILSHLFVVALVVLMVNLGFWQLRRLDQRRAFNDEVRTALAAEPVSLAPGDAPDEWRRVRLRGTFRAGTDVLVANRVENEQPGYWVVTQFDTAQGSYAVGRGFLALPLVSRGGLAANPAPSGEVEVIGRVQDSRGGTFASSSTTGAPEISKVDLTDIAAKWGVSLGPVWVQSDTAFGDSLVAVSTPALTEGPHLGYAFQWFAFSTIAVVGYPLVLRRVARDKSTGIDDEDDDAS